MHADSLGVASGRARRARNVWRTAGALASAMMVWSVVAAPPSAGQEGQIREPSDLAAYSTYADAMPIQLYFDHQLRQIPLGPAIAHAQSEVSLPSAASGIAWLVDGGVANGLHGTTTGAKVPTEASAKQPGGEPQEEFRVAGGPVGDNDMAYLDAGRAYATASHSDNPRAYATSNVGTVLFMPAAGSPPDAPGTYDPNATFPGGEPGATDPAPRGQMGILSIGSIASTSESLREGSTVTSIAVAELQDVNIGNRTSDNRCTNCIRIDHIRAEAFARSNGSPGGSQASYRVIVGRACRRAFDANAGTEADECLPLDPHEPEGSRGLQRIGQLEQLNRFFERPIWYEVTSGEVDYMIGIRVHAGARHRSDARSRRTSDPPDDARRNYAYPADRRHDRDHGEVAKAVAEGLDIEIWTITLQQAHDDAQRRIKGTPMQDLIDQVDEDDAQPGIQVSGPGPLANQTGQQTIPTQTVRSIRRLQMTFGVARASAVARGLSSFGSTSAGAPSSGGLGGGIASGGVDYGGSSSGDGLGTAAPTGIAGPLSLRIDWSSFHVKPWPPYDMAKAIFVGAMLAGIWWLARRRRAVSPQATAKGSGR